eukprot:TRINITY_DN1462_c0_g2_i8.p1 TRINITY_DN1462_c0_g2~~TRINITY_DN1462_c0_g2_i8.p1  ORF type:complete len:382 (+),score=60.12 TRINITY_DN1462_c0_g2_i8:141-1286(+)
MGNCVVSKKSTTRGVLISAGVWKRSHQNELDFHLQPISTPHCVTSSCQIAQTQFGLVVQRQGDIEYDSLFCIGSINGKFWVYRNVKNEVEEPMWVVLPNTEPEKSLQSFRLQTDDVFKMGQYKFVVKHIVKDKERVDSKILKEINQNIMAGRCCTEPSVGEGEQLKVHDSSSSCDGAQCRICLESRSTEDNPLIVSPCKCAGTIKLLHEKCLRKWLKSQVVIKVTSTVRSYYWKSFKCDVCKSRYPDYIRLTNNQPLQFIDIQYPNSNYVILEATSNRLTDDKCNSVQILDLFIATPKPDETISLGRLAVSDIRVNDITVSRHHALIRNRRGDYFLEDASSKFGTMLVARAPVEVQREGTLTVQVNQTRVKLAAHPSGKAR